MIKEVLCANTPIRNPKRGKESRVGRASWYRYYAGFSTTFVQDALTYAAPNAHARILDPWVGSGTTTEIAAAQGFEALGYDINPAMVIVAKARLLDPTVHPSLPSILDDLLSKAAQRRPVEPAEPLAQWFTTGTAGALRQFEHAVQTLLINPRDYRPLFELPTLNQVSSLAAFFYVAAFRVLRELLCSFGTTNPTWIKLPGTDERVTVPEKRLHAILREAVNAMANHLKTPEQRAVSRCSATIEKATSSSLPISDCSIDTVISSPPYCTRIDYVNKTSPELALLGATSVAVKRLRDQMIGTPTIHKATPEVETAWGPTCNAAVDAIARHTSYASKSYYWKTYMQYFHGLGASLREIDRTLKAAGRCMLVVQDSYFKDVHIDLAKIIEEMGQALGWGSFTRADFPTKKTIVGLNTHARDYGNPKQSIETVLGFRKER